ncbi:hypothetical protein ANCDUO_03476 [Ancylostoma duodenale]|uniref:Uncharacterized protein n=1 Tax=Ancylostoma duodenale TaxID=51022 RepID=A0A0C2DTR3_9BILA|nr:hypothetical protein ANCDUO_03476 [Ancylostoma duodenale]
MSENAAAPQEPTFRFGNGVELPPFRTVSDFLLGKARFEFGSWLVQFLSSYLLLWEVLTALNRCDLALGLAAIVVVAAVVIFAISDNPSFYQVLPSVLTVLFR